MLFLLCLHDFKFQKRRIHINIHILYFYRCKDKQYHAIHNDSLIVPTANENFGKKYKITESLAT